MAEWLALQTSDHGVAGLNLAGGEILPEPKRHFIAQSLSCSPFHRLEMTEILFPRKYWLITQEAMAPSRHDWKIVDWDVKPQHNQLKYCWRGVKP